MACAPGMHTPKRPFMEGRTGGCGILSGGVSGCGLSQTRGRTEKNSACNDKRFGRAVHALSGRRGGSELWRCPVAAWCPCGASVLAISRSTQPDNDPECTVQSGFGADDLGGAGSSVEGPKAANLRRICVLPNTPTACFNGLACASCTED